MKTRQEIKALAKDAMKQQRGTGLKSAGAFLFAFLFAGISPMQMRKLAL